MFFENKNVKKIHDKIFYYPNFISLKKVKEINDAMKKYSLDKIRAMDNPDPIDWYKGKISPVIPELMEVWEEINIFLSPEYIVHPQLHLQVIHPGDNGMFLHSDSPGEHNEDMLTQNDKWNTCCIIHYGLVVYFGEFEGGENYYPKQNIEFKVNPGDMVIHGAHDDTMHGVREVTSGYRYAYANFVLPKEKNPGSFYAYDTEAHEKRKNNLELWLTPLS
jgi:hypothetical protein